MLPIGVSAPPQRTRPWVTYALAGLALAVFVHSTLLRHTAFPAYCTDLSESAAAVHRAAGTLPGFLCRYGATPDDLHKGQHLETLLTSTFVHAGWFHLLSNLLFLLAFAPRVEEDAGHAGLLALFLGTGALATYAHVLVVPDSVTPALGASGAVAGVLGAHLLLAPRATVRVLVGPVPVRLPTWFVLGLWAVLELVYTWLTLRRAEYPVGVTYEVHAVGFALGLLAGVVLLARTGRLHSLVPLRAGTSAPR